MIQTIPFSIQSTIEEIIEKSLSSFLSCGKLLPKNILHFLPYNSISDLTKIKEVSK
jgi:hypothetical protein